LPPLARKPEVFSLRHQIYSLSEIERVAFSTEDDDMGGVSAFLLIGPFIDLPRCFHSQIPEENVLYGVGRVHLYFLMPNIYSPFSEHLTREARSQI
jgi:hypothetical protein